MNFFKTTQARRFNKFHERFLYTRASRIAIGFVFILSLVLFSLPIQLGDVRIYSTVFNSLCSAIVFYILTDTTIAIMSKYPAVHGVKYVFPASFSVGIGVGATIIILRIDYSRSVLVVSLSAAFLYLFLSSYIINKYRRLKIAIVPCGDAMSLTGIHGVSWRVLNKTDLENTRFDAIAADLNALTPEWEKFVASMTLWGVTVIRSKKLYERLTGRVNTQHLPSGAEGNLMPSTIYATLKRFIDIFCVVISFPIVIPMTLIAALVIKIESPGDAIFTQYRVGKGGGEFKIYKLRSMCTHSEEGGAQFASSKDMRVTKFGRVIRKTRIDELPQFFNILKGDMSLIGPRPEQQVFVTQFEKTIPFYGYRHVVRPGITGWAQVTHGYAASEDETRLKLEHDLYYIKNFSLWLDIVIVFKTIHTMMTGFGAR